MVATAKRDKSPQRSVELGQGHVVREMQHVLELCQTRVRLHLLASAVIWGAPDQNCWAFSIIYTMPLTSIVVVFDDGTEATWMGEGKGEMLG